MIKTIFSLLFLQVSLAASELQDLVLVNAKTGNIIRTLIDGDIIDLNQVGTSLSVQARTLGSMDCVMFDFDHGKLQRTSRNQQHFLAGQKKGKKPRPYEYEGLKKVGKHSLSARPCHDGQLEKLARGHGTPKVKPANIVEPDANERRMQGKPNSPANEPLNKPAEKPRKNLLHDRQLEDSKAIAVEFTIVEDASKAYAGAKLPNTDVGAYDTDVFGAITGELKKWHKVTLGFRGPIAAETGNTVPGVAYRTPSTFADYAFSVRFTHEDGLTVKVPGYYAGNGNSHNGGANTNGDVWLCHFRPSLAGDWSWEAEFKHGTNAAQNDSGDSASFFDGVTGDFYVEDTDKEGRDLRSKGRLEYVGKHHLKFAESGEYFLKAGPDSPTNFLAYEDFDDTPNKGLYLKKYEEHKKDYGRGQPTWRNGRGKGIIGALNYLASKGMNAISVSLLSNDGICFPFINGRENDHYKYDISKLAQWEIVFDYAEQLGIVLHMKFQDSEDDLFGDYVLSEERKLFYYEMIARFGHHLGVIWDLGQEVSDVNLIQKRSEYVRKMDPYNSPIVVHAAESEQKDVYSGLLGLDSIEGVSMQTDPSTASASTLKWVEESTKAGKPWIVSVDQQHMHVGVTADGDGNNHDEIRQQVLWGNIMSGGAGVQYSFGSSNLESDLTAQRFDSRSSIWDQSKHAIDFFSNNRVPFYDMSNKNDWVTGTSFCLVSDDKRTIIVYKTDAQVSVDLPAGKYALSWYDPRNGGALQQTSQAVLTGGSSQTLDSVPGNDQSADWVALLTYVGI